MKATPTVLHNEYNIVPDRSNIHLRYQYMLTVRQWKFVGYRCSACNQSLKHQNAAIKHNSCCKILNTVAKREKPDTTVLNVYRSQWQPLVNNVDGPDL
jgi:hypothetical protein